VPDEPRNGDFLTEAKPKTLKSARGKLNVAAKKEKFQNPNKKRRARG